MQGGFTSPIGNAGNRGACQSPQWTIAPENSLPEILTRYDWLLFESVRVMITAEFDQFLCRYPVYHPRLLSKQSKGA
jgi:hypothetical protein